MPFRFDPKAQLLALMLASALVLAVHGGAAIVVIQLLMIGGVGSLLLQLGNLTVGGPRQPGGPMSPKQVVLTFAAGFALCFAGTFILMLLFGSGIVVTADTIDRIPYETMRNPAMHMGLILAGWNLAMLAGGFYVALLLTGGVLAGFQLFRKRREAPARTAPAKNA